MNDQIKSEMRHPRYAELDSLRGIAALIVVLHHFSRLWDPHKMSLPTLLVTQVLMRPFIAGVESVVLFFVMSGFVLALPYTKNKGLPYSHFLIRRIFRIYVPYLFALALAVLGDAWLHARVRVDPWFDGGWSGPVSWHLVLQHVLFLGNYNVFQFNAVFWSLVVEMRVSIIFPALCLALLLLPDLLGALGLTALYFIGNYMIPGSHPILQTLGWLPMFAGGILLAKNVPSLRAFYNGLSRRVRVIFGVVSLFLFFYSRAVPPRFRPMIGQFSDFGVFVGAVWILTVALCSTRVRNFLLGRPWRFLGKISYSLYLIHLPILYMFVELLYGKLSMLWLLPIYFVSVLAAATLFWRLVENPFTQLGRRVTQATQSMPVGAVIAVPAEGCSAEVVQAD